MTQLTRCSSVSGRGKGQGSAVFSSLLLSAAGPGQKSDQNRKGPDFKEEETQRGFCQQTQVIITVMFCCGRSSFYCTDSFLWESCNILDLKVLVKCFHFHSNKSSSKMCLCLFGNNQAFSTVIINVHLHKHFRAFSFVWRWMYTTTVSHNTSIVLFSHEKIIKEIYIHTLQTKHYIHVHICNLWAHN